MAAANQEQIQAAVENANRRTLAADLNIKCPRIGQENQFTQSLEFMNFIKTVERKADMRGANNAQKANYLYDSLSPEAEEKVFNVAPGTEGNEWEIAQKRVKDALVSPTFEEDCKTMFYTTGENNKNTLEFINTLYKWAIHVTFANEDARKAAVLDHAKHKTQNLRWRRDMVRDNLGYDAAYELARTQQIESQRNKHIQEVTQGQLKANGHSVNKVRGRGRGGGRRFGPRNTSKPFCATACGRHHYPNDICGAMGQKCDSCGKFNHFAKVCPNKRNQKRGYGYSRGQNRGQSFGGNRGHRGYYRNQRRGNNRSYGRHYKVSDESQQQQQQHQYDDYNQGYNQSHSTEDQLVDEFEKHCKLTRSSF